MLTERSSRKEIENCAKNLNHTMDSLCLAWKGRKWEEAHMNYTFEDYRAALEGAGPKLKELVLDRAAHDPAIDFKVLKALVEFAYPEAT